MNYLDLFIAIPIAWGAFVGFRKGFVIELASLLALGLGIYGSVKFSTLTATYLNEYVEWSHQAMKLISFVITFLIIVLVVHLIARLIQKFVKLAALGMVNRIVGLLFGVLKYLLITSSIIFVVTSINDRYPFIDNKVTEESLLYQPVSEIIPTLYPLIQDSFQENI